MNALLGRASAFHPWELRQGESFAARKNLLQFLDTPSAKSELLDFLRNEKVPRELANCLLEAAKIPTMIPIGAMNVLGLEVGRDASPLDWPMVFWDTPGGLKDRWYWRRNDWPIIAVQLKDGSWERQTATY